MHSLVRILCFAVEDMAAVSGTARTVRVESVLLVNSFPVLYWPSSFAVSLSLLPPFSLSAPEIISCPCLFSMNNSAIAVQEHFIVRCRQYSVSVGGLVHLGSDTFPILLCNYVWIQKLSSRLPEVELVDLKFK